MKISIFVTWNGMGFVAGLLRTDIRSVLVVKEENIVVF